MLILPRLPSAPCFLCMSLVFVGHTFGLDFGISRIGPSFQSTRVHFWRTTAWHLLRPPCLLLGPKYPSVQVIPALTLTGRVSGSPSCQCSQCGGEEWVEQEINTPICLMLWRIKYTTETQGSRFISNKSAQFCFTIQIRYSKRTFKEFDWYANWSFTVMFQHTHIPIGLRDWSLVGDYISSENVCFVYVHTLASLRVEVLLLVSSRLPFHPSFKPDTSINAFPFWWNISLFVFFSLLRRFLVHRLHRVSHLEVCSCRAARINWTGSISGCYRSQTTQVPLAQIYELQCAEPWSCRKCYNQGWFHIHLLEVHTEKGFNQPLI